MILKLRVDQRLIRPQIGKLFRIAAVRLFLFPLRRARTDSIFLPVGKGIFQPAQGIGQNGNDPFGQTQMDQRVAQAQIQQFAFPLGNFSRRFGRRSFFHFNLFCALLRGSGNFCRVPLRCFDMPAGIGQDTLRQWMDTAQAGTAHIYNVLNGFSQFPLRCSTGPIKIQGFSGCQGRAFHHGYLADAIRQTLGQQTGVILHCFGEGLFFQPYPCKNMPRLQNQQGMQTDGFQHRSIQ